MKTAITITVRTPPKSARQKYASDSARWTAVVTRDSQADGHFCYSVKTTGVYCRPSCPSRQAKRENVQFHDSCAEAERAGFRPCRRCQPNGPKPTEQYAAIITTACRTIETSETPPALDALARAAGLSRFHFHRLFKQHTGLTPKAYATAHRDAALRRALPQRATVTEAIYEAGFNSNSRFYEKSAQTLGMAPQSFRAGGPGETIRFALAECSLGSLLVAASAKGICALALGDSPDQLLRDFQDQFPKAQLLGGDKAFKQTVAQVIAFVEAPRLGLAHPHDIRGTAFQQRVWQALRQIPAGTTVSYSKLAERIGSPRSVRAVASACAANSIAIAIPCHRVVRIGGGLSGYRWGIKRKRSLLDREAA
jgi:AraC family transcriptional regulator of adaptative response/methylated-DNA-[protein]-cysteine methyltransferase